MTIDKSGITSAGILLFRRAGDDLEDLLGDVRRAGECLDLGADLDDLQQEVARAEGAHLVGGVEAGVALGVACRARDRFGGHMRHQTRLADDVAQMIFQIHVARRLEDAAAEVKRRTGGTEGRKGNEGPRPGEPSLASLPSVESPPTQSRQQAPYGMFSLPPTLLQTSQNRGQPVEVHQSGRIVALSNWECPVQD